MVAAQGLSLWTGRPVLAEIGQRFTRDTGIRIRIDHIAHPQQAAKYASEVQTQAGHDLVEMRMHFPWLYETQLVDVSDLVAELEAKYGKAISSAQETAYVRGVWRALYGEEPETIPPYSRDWAEAGGRETLAEAAHAAHPAGRHRR
mgnify:CR=1 FL=1